MKKSYESNAQKIAKTRINTGFLAPTGGGGVDSCNLSTTSLKLTNLALLNNAFTLNKISSKSELFNPLTLQILLDNTRTSIYKGGALWELTE